MRNTLLLILILPALALCQQPGGSSLDSQNARRIQRRNVAATAPTNLQVLQWRGAILAAVFTGIGLDDATSGGTYTGNVNAAFEVVIDASVPSPDTFKWRKDGGGWTANVGITGAAQALSDGVTVTFGAVDGHTVNDQWSIYVTTQWEPNILATGGVGGADALTNAGRLPYVAGTTPGAVTFTGTGLNDMTAGGIYLGTSAATYCTIIDATGTPDTFKWGTDAPCSNGATGVAITGSAQSLSNGLTVTFAATTGHTLSDKWSFSVADPGGVLAESMFSYDPNTGQATFTRDGVAATSFLGLSLRNTTAATAGVPEQWSPGLVLSGNAWDSTAAVSRNVVWTLDRAAQKSVQFGDDVFFGLLNLRLGATIGGTYHRLLHMYHDPSGTPFSDGPAPNLFIGWNAGNTTMTGASFANLGIGQYALKSLALDAHENMGIGPYSALYSLTTGDWNACGGIECLANTTVGNSNVAWGQGAGWDNIDGSFNSYFGVSAGAQCTTANRSGTTSIGYRSCADQANMVALGRPGDKATIGGLRYSEATLHVIDAGALGPEVLSEPDFTTHVKWSVDTSYWDANFTGGKANFIGGAGYSYGNVRQDILDLATPAVANAWYVFTYTASAVFGDAACQLNPTGGMFVGTISLPLNMQGGVATVHVKTTAAPNDFQIYCESNYPASTVSFDDLTLKQVNGGDLLVNARMTSYMLPVTFSATPTFNAALGNSFKITLTGNVTSSTLSNTALGQQLSFLICQDATGSRTFVWPTNVKGGMTIGSTLSTCSAQSFIYDGVNAYATASGVTGM